MATGEDRSESMATVSVVTGEDRSESMATVSVATGEDRSERARVEGEGGG